MAGSGEPRIGVAFLIAVVLAITACTSSDDVGMLREENSELRTELAALQDQVDEQAEKLEAAGDDLDDLRSEVSSPSSAQVRCGALLPNSRRACSKSPTPMTRRFPPSESTLNRA